MKDVHYYPEPEEVLNDESRDDRLDTREDFIDQMFKHARHNDTATAKDQSLKCLHEMNKLLPEIVEKTNRKSLSHTRRSFWYPMNGKFYTGYWDHTDVMNRSEDYKYSLVSRLSLAWYLNARRFIYRSLKMREPIMEDKRYKIGFLFHALRMNVFDQHKLLQGMQQQDGMNNQRNFETTILIYTKILRMNVDLNDLISYLRLLHYHQPDPLLKSTWDFEYKRDPRNKKYTGIMVKNKTKGPV